MKSRFFLKESAQEIYIPINIHHTEEKVDWVTPAMEAFRREWKNSKYFKRYPQKI